MKKIKCRNKIILTLIVFIIIFTNTGYSAEIYSAKPGFLRVNLFSTSQSAKARVDELVLKKEIQEKIEDFFGAIKQEKDYGWGNRKGYFDNLFKRENSGCIERLYSLIEKYKKSNDLFVLEYIRKEIDDEIVSLETTHARNRTRNVIEKINEAIELVSEKLLAKSLPVEDRKETLVVTSKKKIEDFFDAIKQEKDYGWGNRKGYFDNLFKKGNSGCIERLYSLIEEYKNSNDLFMLEYSRKNLEHEMVYLESVSASMYTKKAIDKIDNAVEDIRQMIPEYRNYRKHMKDVRAGIRMTVKDL